MARGNNKQEIFLGDRDRVQFLRNLQHCTSFHNLVIHAYCLMGNHYHLLIETPDGNLSKAMRDINGNYTQWFNSHHEQVGHLFQGRYKAFLVEKDLYFMEVSRYIVNNPVEAGLVDHPQDWQWSNYRSVVGLNLTPDFLETNFTLDHFSSEGDYQSFVEEGFGVPKPHDEFKEGVILGSPQYIQWIWETQTNGSEVNKELPREDRVVGRPSLNELFLDIETKQERDEMIRFARLRCGYLVSEIARHLDLDRSTVGKIARLK